MIVLIVIGLIPGIIATAFIVRDYKQRAIKLRTVNVANQCSMLCNTIATDGTLAKDADPQLKEELSRELSMLSNVYNGRLLVVNSDFIITEDTYELDINKTSMSREVISCFKSKKEASYYDRENEFIEITAPIMKTGSDDMQGVLVASVSTTEFEQTALYLERQGILVMICVTVLVLILGYFLADMLVRPFRRVTHAIEDVTDGYENEAISVPDYTETEQITEAFNRMLARVRSLDDSRQEFVSNVSHELKTPLTSMKVLADSLNGQENVPIEIYQEFMGDITKEIDRENDIITDLLTMVRMDRKNAELNLEVVEIGSMLEAVVHRLEPIADKKRVRLIMLGYKPVKAEIDQTKLSLAFSNLIENAIKYNVEDGWVHVTLRWDRKYFYVSVADCGLGIPEDQQERIFERFYRGDVSHSTTIEGTGLGLAITREIVMLHRGVIKVDSTVGEGTTFKVRIPLHQET
ncbi:MAG: HAMP domain-containing sensor histidine kinase [Lachnospiraceae bacterium]|nr:HAMP domain-containing sensor histidine kinase [Lachnospiraceae bacterium]